MTQSSGQIIKSHGRRYVVEASDGRRYDCTTRGKRTDYACGDRVDLLIHNDEQAVIERAQPRRSLLYRQDDFRQKLIAANVTQVLVVVATEPGFSFDLVCRTLVAAQAQDVAARILLNKCDLTDKLETARQALAPFIDEMTDYLVEKAGINGFTRQLRTGFERNIAGE